ncbi:MAG TPA: hypothetical protein VL400_25310 [Polyangiaceae bacterium]|nr:hypothetical protein [Polyangiaceae bacterium]
MPSPRTCLVAISFACVIVSGCDPKPRPASPTAGWGAPPVAPTATAPAEDPRIAIWANECADLIGTINAGIEAVGKSKGSADAGKSDLAATAESLESVATEVDGKQYTNPDLAQLKAIYAQVTRGLADTTRDTEASLNALHDAQEAAAAKKTDKALAAAVTTAQDDLAKVAEKADGYTDNEAETVDKINQVCAAFTEPADSPEAPPTGPSAPGAPPAAAPPGAAPPPGPPAP